MGRSIWLLVHSARRARPLVLAVGLLLGGFQVLLTLVAGALHESGSFARVATMVPSFVRELLGPSLPGVMSFAGILCLGYFHPIVMASTVGLAIVLATEPAAEIESRFVDLILSRPLARHWVITRSVALVSGSSALVLGLMRIGSAAGSGWLSPDGVDGPRPGLLGSLALNLGALTLCWGGIALLLASLSRRRGAAGALAGLLALACFLLDYVARVWSPAARVSWLSPFHYYNPFDLVMGEALPGSHLWVLLGIAAFSAGGAYAVYARRDL